MSLLLFRIAEKIAPVCFSSNQISLGITPTVIPSQIDNAPGGQETPGVPRLIQIRNNHPSGFLFRM
jgi:hypothetical protein